MLFQKDPVKQLASKLETETDKRDKIAARLAIAANSATESRSAAQRLALNGADDNALDQAEAVCRVAQDRVVTLTAALAESESQVAILERDLATLLDTKQRAETAVELETMAVDLERLVPLSDELFTKMAEIAGCASGAQIWDARGLNDYAVASRTQIPDAIAVTAKALRWHRDGVLAGRERAVLLKPGRPVDVAVMEPAVTRVFAMTNIAWTGPEGRVQTSGKYNDTDLPPAIAARALAKGLCEEIGSPIWRQRSGTRALVKPPILECTSLDEIGGAGAVPLNDKATDAPSDPRFTKIDRGPVVELRIPREVQP